ncbi:hypothetical protein GGE07_006322 [Sinorhizobium terangae]|nr:hypothetical protein [Sinorhizobium terangae]
MISRSRNAPFEGRNQAFLRIDHGNDYSFVEVTLFDENGTRHELGNVKIGFKGQTTQTPTYSTLQASFSFLDDRYFSLGTDVDYYRALGEKVFPSCRNEFLNALRDTVADERALEGAQEESVLSRYFVIRQCR